MHRTRIKICGLTREADVDAAVDAGVDAVGFVLYEPSPRAVSAARAAVLARRLPPFVTPVLLFVNAETASVSLALQAVPGAMAQFHGDETPGACDAAAAGHRYLKAARMGGGSLVSSAGLLDFACLYPQAQALLLDAHVDAYGGAGKVFDWSLVPAHVPARLVLSGGLHVANVGEGIARLRPWGVDVSSGVEAAKGLKDTGLIRRFCAAVREADQTLSSAAPPEA
jgi:phosphoribosylanthranilate isomerase